MANSWQHGAGHERQRGAAAAQGRQSAFYLPVRAVPPRSNSCSWWLILTHPQTLSPYSLIPRLSHRSAGQTLCTVKYLEDSKYFQDSPSSLYLLPSSHVSPQPRIPSPQDAASGTAHMRNMHSILRMRNLGHA